MKVNFKRALALAAGLFMAAPFAAMPANTADSVQAAGNVPAFPGAVGGGKYATGGRGGEVVHVTNLNDSGEGSLREAVSQPGRIVVFDVSGTIELKGNIIVQSNTTIAGQTAPGGSGVTLKNYKLGMGGDNIICRFISSRPGPYASSSKGNDAWGGAKGSNSVIDHCSMSWTTDEQWGLYSNNEYYTVQYSVIGPADSWGGHDKGLHGFGIMMGNGNLTFDHNLIIHNVSRNFRGKVPGTKTADFTNNVIYNWAYETAYGTIGHLNYVGNTLKMGSGTTGGKRYVNVDSSTSPQNFKIFLKGNRMLNRDGSVYGDVTWDNWNGITVKDGLGITKDGLKSSSSFPINSNNENISTADKTESAENSYNNVVKFAGNGISTDMRTAVDKQCAYEVQTGTGNLSGTSSYASADATNQANINKYQIKCDTKYNYPAPVLTKTVTDTDNDGMPDDWETARGLDPANPDDTDGDYCGQGYTNIEYYLNDLTVNAFPAGVVKLSPTSGFTPAVPVTVDGTLIKDLKVKDSANKASWQLTEGNKTGSRIFGDRDYTFATFPDEISGAEGISTACGSKNYSGDMATFLAGSDITVHVALDSRISPPPSWLESWTKTNMTCSSTNDVTFEIYSKDFAKDEKVVLGTNSQTNLCVNYCVFVTERRSAEPPVTEPEITEPPVTEPPATEPPVTDTEAPPEPEYIKGDTNLDGSVTSADLVALTETLLGKLQLPETSTEISDMNSDGTLNIIDLILLRVVLCS